MQVMDSISWLDETEPMNCALKSPCFWEFGAALTACVDIIYNSFV